MIFPFHGGSLGINQDNQHYQISSKEVVFYVYKIQKDETYQLGLVCLVSFTSDSNVRIHPHESTIFEKENHYFKQLQEDGLQSSPVVFVHKQSPAILNLMNRVVKTPSTFSIKGCDQITHCFWKITKSYWLQLIQEAYKMVNELYIADGHHRFAALKRLQRVKPWINKIMSLLIPDNQIRILPFHRSIVFSNLTTKQIFFHSIKKNFTVYQVDKAFQPSYQHQFGVCINKQWYVIELKKSIVQSLKEHETISAFLFEKYLLSLCGDYKIQYLSGDYNLLAIRDQVDVSEPIIFFSLASVKIQDFFKRAGAGQLFPPHSTCFFPKPLNNFMVYAMNLDVRLLTEPSCE